MKSSFWMIRIKHVATTLLAVMAMLSAACVAAQTKEPELPSLDSVLGELRQGGLVIYFRHGVTETSGPAEEVVDLERCETQRNLSAKGRETMTQIGKAIQTLGIPVATVQSSPFCRCKDTAQLALGKFTISKDLYFAINTSDQETKRLTTSLRQMLATPPASNTNAFIVSHTANLREAAGIWPKPEGVACVFWPLSDGKFKPVAKILPEDWLEVAKKNDGVSHPS